MSEVEKKRSNTLCIVVVASLIVGAVIFVGVIAVVVWTTALKGPAAGLNRYHIV